MNVLKMSEIDLKGKRVLIREDFNVPIENGHVKNDHRIQIALPTINAALNAGAKIYLMSHLGRPKEGEFDPKYSLAPVADRLSKLINRRVALMTDLNDTCEATVDICLLENVRFNVGETENDAGLAKKLAALCDVFVMDAFATAHRKHASTYGVAEFAPVACAGPLLVNEVNALELAFSEPKLPLVAIVGGSKVSTKLPILKSLVSKVDKLIVGGGIANTILVALGYRIGKSLYEPDFIPEANNLLDIAKKNKVEIPLPIDVVVATSMGEHSTAIVKDIDQIEKHEMILDVGPRTIELFNKVIQSAATILWNGPVGVFELDQFGEGTKKLSQAIAKSSAFSLAGGGDTIAAIDKYNVADDMSYISTGGGAFLEFIEGEKLPAIEILEKRAKK